MDKLKAAIVCVDRLITLSEEKVKTLRGLRVALLMKLYPELNWQRDRYDPLNRPHWTRSVALMASRKFKDEQSTAREA